MYKLTIKRADDSVYWTEGFNNIDEGNAWLAVEQARPYWDSEWTYEFQDISLSGQALLDAKWLELRSLRNEKLTACDWTQLTDSPLSSELKTAWATYRQALRDLPQQEGLDPANPTWPEQP